MQQQPYKNVPRALSAPKRRTSTPHAIRTRGREQDMLEMFIGQWQVSGYNEPSPPGSGRAVVTGSQEYTWLPGEFFVSGSWSHQFATRTHEGVSVLGFEPERAGYFAHNYDSLGYARAYAVSLAGSIWTFSGPFERATFAFSEDGQRYSETWQLTKDGQSWQPLCALEALRIGA